MTQNQTAIVVSALALAGVFASACNQSPTHDLGYTAEDLTRSEEPSVPPVAELSTDFAGTWIGEADDPLALLSGADVSPPVFRFASGSSRILLELNENPDFPYVSGTITFGEGVLLPATDPDLGYPVDPGFRITSSVIGDDSIRPPFEGFAYSTAPGITSRELGALGLDLQGETDFFNAGRIVDGKLDLPYLPTEVFGGWCALQTADSCPSNQQVSWDDETGECFSGLEFTPMDCQKVAQCASNSCSCLDDGSACSYSVERLSALTIRLSDDGLVGLFSGAVFVNERGFQQPLGTVRFRRAAAADAGAP
jgi:hypothetical protein